ncbi:MAG: sigma-54 factor interaction domain-containing protein, partial [Sphingobacteriales bacterium]
MKGGKKENFHSNRAKQSNGDRNSYFVVNPFIWEVEQKNPTMEALQAAIREYFRIYWQSSYFEIQSRINESDFANDTVCSVYFAGKGNEKPDQERYSSLLNSGGIKMLVSIPIKIKDHESRMIWVGTSSSSRIDGSFDSSLDLLRRQLTIAFTAQSREDKIKKQDLALNQLKSLLKLQGVNIQEEKIKQEVFPDIIGQSGEMKEVFSLINRVSSSETTVLILGETGTGKELIAKAIHNGSPRRGKTMVRVNCAAIPASLIESELFGHEKGSFTGATDRRIGKFELAHNGTIFLDEIGELPLELQVKLLRVIQEKEIERIGGKKTITTDVRIISATNRNLWQEVENGQFRRDLF